MAVEMNKSPSVRLTPVQEIKLAKPATDLYVGQILKTVVVTALTNNQVLININGQNLNAKSSHHFTPGELLEVKVIANKNETVLEVQPKAPPLSVLQNALLLNLPKQAPATNLLNTLNHLVKMETVPVSINQQIRDILGNLISVPQSAQQLMQAIGHCGLFFESALLNWKPGKDSQPVKVDFKGQCIKLLKSLPVSETNNTELFTAAESPSLEQDALPLPGVIPQPLPQCSLACSADQSVNDMLGILREQLTQVIARITAHQINHLSQADKNGYLIMLDLPIKTFEHIDVLPLKIEQHKAEPMNQSRWSMSFALSLSRLGDLQATVFLYGNHVDIKINAQQVDTMTALNEAQPEIKKLLEELGLNLDHWKLQLGLENNHIDVTNLHLLDIRI